MTYTEWVRETAKSFFAEYPQHQRLGQFYMNDLRDRIPDLYEAITGTSHDPFYRNEVIPEFLGVVAYHWDSYTQEP